MSKLRYCKRDRIILIYPINVIALSPPKQVKCDRYPFNTFSF
ncbi:hypothetical protein [Fischerella thermalis]|nr:hypothetical protein [Fischerella thermalis]